MSKPEIVGYLNFGALTGKPVVSADCWSELASEPLIRLADHEAAMREFRQAMHAMAKSVGAKLAADHESSRAADKARIAELEKERDEWHRLFDSAGQLSKNACDDLNSAKSRIAELVLSLRTVVGMLHHRATTPLERQAIRIAETALAQQGKEGET